MLKRLITITVCCTLLFAILFSISYAHPGDTDENGGHYDRSTGEYHYHHGYPAHDHPGGVCPYDYKDNTDHTTRSGSSSSAGKSSGAIILSAAISVIIFAGAAIAFFALRDTYLRSKKMNHLKAVDIPRLHKEYDHLCESVSSLHEMMLEHLSDECARLVHYRARIKTKYESMANLTPEQYAGVPSDTYLDSNIYPIERNAHGDMEDKYFFCYTCSTGVIHKTNCRYACGAPVNYYYIKHCQDKPIKVCHHCRPELPDISWVDKYRNVLSNLEAIDPGITNRSLKLLRHTVPTPSSDMRVAVEAKNGMLVWVKAKDLPAWKAAQYNPNVDMEIIKKRADRITKLLLDSSKDG